MPAIITTMDIIRAIMYRVAMAATTTATTAVTATKATMVQVEMAATTRGMTVAAVTLVPEDGAVIKVVR
jgi:hypothetical protein